MTPSASVRACSGNLCKRRRPSTSASTGSLRDSRCLRAFARTQNAAHAAASSSNDAYWSAKFALVGTRSAFAILTVASAPPFDSGSSGFDSGSSATQVLT